MTDPASVGVRELRQNLSVYLRRVAAGATLRVTERGAPVALLTPLPGRASALDRLVASGLATPASGDVLDVDPVKAAERRNGRPTVSQALQEQRAERL